VGKRGLISRLFHPLSTSGIRLALSRSMGGEWWWIAGAVRTRGGAGAPPTAYEPPGARGK
jgi:hypothetical protein